ncbi:ENTH-domain-containing protein [Thelephora ganbajun]|uniref:ENTH-domain-containing protein n=1 Tax=Thelephora ganbajun TaxID=370292 RepID=A0ACB6ZLX8_THEGA|nr:ENTH-domain-containing protein [Thelephora ganbajun]
MSIQHFGKGALRVAKNYTKGYSDIQAKVRDATSNDPWGPSGTQMNEIAQMTYNQNDFVEIMEVLDKRLNDKGKNWRHVFKSLTLLDYCLHAGSENVVIYFRDNLYVIKTLKEFQYVDEYGKDQGANVRQKAKDITNLLSDDTRLREERRSRAHMRDRMTRSPVEDTDLGDENERRRSRSRQNARTNTTDDDLRKAIEESKRTAAAESGHLTAEDRDLQEALRLSREEEEKRKKATQDSTESALFDDNNQLVSDSPAPNNGFPLTDASSQPQFTGLQPQFTTIQPQFTAFNPWQQQAQQEAIQAQWVQQQAEWLRQQQELQAQQQAQLQLAQQQEEWLRQQQQQQLFLQQQQQQMFLQPQANPLIVQPTGFGSNNPFAPAPPVSTPSPTSLSPPQQNSVPTFNLPGTFENRTNGMSPSPGPSPASQATNLPKANPQKGTTRGDQEHAHLARLIANADDGVDTFGNYGQLRCVSASVLLCRAVPDRLHRYGGTMNKVGTNPFSKPQQPQNPEQPFFSI